ncbi:MAG: endolytic transglycosylase MltG [bacterium]|nr:endolytic transglycosylase MltG [bacterium]
MAVIDNINKKNLILAGLILVLAVSVIIFLNQFSAPQRKAAEERIVVNLATTEAELIPKLKQQGYIRSEWAFNFALKIKNWRGKIKSGGYTVSKSMSVWQLADILVNHPYQKWAVIPEGLRKEEIAYIIQNKIGWPDSEKEKFIKNSKEGYLFPDTYLFDLAYKSDDAIKKMENNFNEKTADSIKEAKVKNIRNDTLIVLASLIQREAANEKEMPLIASVIWNRWTKSIPFQIDATVQYALGEPGNWWKKVKLEDYKINSPYNTYIHQGRPPAPISNPGLAAINAVINPEKTDYLYYLHDSAGQIHLAKTYEEHLKNIEKYLK